MEYIFDLTSAIAMVLSFAVGLILMYVIINKKDEVAIEIYNACKYLMDEFGGDVKAKDEKLYKEMEAELERMYAIIVDGASLWEFLTLMRRVPKVFKSLLELYDVEEWVENALGKVKN